MKFLCERCKTKYSIGDERVRGKILKIRCRNCANIITVREEPPASFELSLELSKMNEGTPGTLDKALNRALGAGGVAAKPSAKDAFGPGPKADTWYVAVGQDQRGPMSLEQAAEQLGKMIKPGEALVWRDGLEDWMRADAVAELKDKLPKPPRPSGPLSSVGAPDAKAGRPSPKLPGAAVAPAFSSLSGPGSGSKPVAKSPAPRPFGEGAIGEMQASSASAAVEAVPVGRSSSRSSSATSIPLSQLMATGSSSAAVSSPMPAPLAATPEAHPNNGNTGSGPSDAALEFAIEEPSRIVRLDSLVPLTGKLSSSGATQSSGKVFALPGLEQDEPTTASTPAMATPTVPLADGSIPPSYAPATPEKREVHHYRMLSVVLGTMVLGLAVAVLWLWPRMTPQKIIVEREKSPEDIGAEIAELLVKEASSLRRADTMAPQAVPDSVPAKSGGKKSRSAGGSKEVKGATAKTGDRLGDLYADTSKGGGPDIRGPERPQEDAVGMFKRGAKLCYERALKRDPSMAQMTKVEVSITTGSTGDVSNIQISDPYRSQFLGQCLSFMIKKLPWPAEGRVWQFPLVFRGS